MKCGAGSSGHCAINYEAVQSSIFDKILSDVKCLIIMSIKNLEFLNAIYSVENMSLQFRLLNHGVSDVKQALHEINNRED